MLGLSSDVVTQEKFRRFFTPGYHANKRKIPCSPSLSSKETTSTLRRKSIVETNNAIQELLSSERFIDHIVPQDIPNCIKNKDLCEVHFKAYQQFMEGEVGDSDEAITTSDDDPVAEIIPSIEEFSTPPAAKDELMPTPSHMRVELVESPDQDAVRVSIKLCPDQAYSRPVAENAEAVREYIADYCFKSEDQDSQQKRGFVYVIRAKQLGLVKIGQTTNLHQRMKDIANECHLVGELTLIQHSGEMSDFKKLEKIIHKDLRPHRQRFECKCTFKQRCGKCNRSPGKCRCAEPFMGEYKHQEWFKIDDDDVVIRAIHFWSDFVRNYPWKKCLNTDPKLRLAEKADLESKWFKKLHCYDTPSIHGYEDGHDDHAGREKRWSEFFDIEYSTRDISERKMMSLLGSPGTPGDLGLAVGPSGILPPRRPRSRSGTPVSPSESKTRATEITTTPTLLRLSPEDRNASSEDLVERRQSAATESRRSRSPFAAAVSNGSHRTRSLSPPSPSLRKVKMEDTPSEIPIPGSWLLPNEPKQQDDEPETSPKSFRLGGSAGTISTDLLRLLWTLLYTVLFASCSPYMPSTLAPVAWVLFLSFFAAELRGWRLTKDPS